MKTFFDYYLKDMKLVRDKIPEIIKKAGKEPMTRIAEDKEYYKLLLKKLKEEVDEFIKSGDEEELVDILEIVNSITKHKNIKIDDLENKRIKKAEQRGSFNNKIVWLGNK